MRGFTKRAVALVLCIFSCAIGFVACNNVPYDYDLDEYITVPEDLTQITVSHDEILAKITKSIDALLDSKATRMNESEVGIRAGHIVKISFKCYKADTEPLMGVPVEINALSDGDCTLAVGNGKYPSELETALMRKTVGEEFDVTVTFDETYATLGLAGTKARYVGKINEVYRVERPEYNDDFVKTATSYQSVEEYENYLYEKMKEELIFDKLLAMSTVINYPTDELQAYAESFAKYYTEQANALGISLEEYVNRKFFISITEFYLRENSYCKETVKKELVLYSLVRKYGIEVSDEEYALSAAQYAAQYGLDSPSKLEAKFGSANVRQTVLMDKLLAYISSQIEVTGAPEQIPA